MHCVSQKTRRGISEKSLDRNRYSTGPGESGLRPRSAERFVPAGFPALHVRLWEVTLFFRHRRRLIANIELEARFSYPPRMTYRGVKTAGALTQPKFPEGTSEDRMDRFIR